jgi:orotate phosphoribosyltransferase
MNTEQTSHRLGREVIKGELMADGVLLMEGHFDYGNGYHGPVYVNPHQLLCEPAKLMRFVQMLVDRLPAPLKDRVDVVAGPQTGGAMIASFVTIALEAIRPLTKPTIKCIQFEKSNGGYSIRRFYAGLLRDKDSNRGLNVLLVDDVFNTGKTLRDCHTLVCQSGGEVVGSAVLVNRNRMAVNLYSLTDEFTEDRYPQDRCPFCQLKIPITLF